MNTRPLRAVFLEPKPPNPHIFSRFTLPRLGTVLLATLLRNRGWEVQVFVEEVADISFDKVLRADLVGISTTTSTAPRAYVLSREIRKSGIPVVLGGPHVTFLPEEGLEQADMVIRGEGEGPILELARHFERGDDFACVPGLSWRAGDRTIHNPLPGKPADLDVLPAPDLSLIHGYIRDGSVTRRTIPIQTARGCPHDCDFCSVTGMFGRRLRKRNPQTIIKELDTYRNLSSSFFICDDNFTADRSHAREICMLIIESGLDIEWHTQVRLEVARDRDLVDLMYRAGCRTVCIGFESVNQKALAESGKYQPVGEMYSAAGTFRRAGIEIHGMFIFGFDSDEAHNLEATLRFAKRAPVTTAQFLILTPLPGTELLRRLTDEDRIFLSNWSLYDGHHVVFKPKHISPRKLQRKQVRSHWRFYSWPRSLACLVKLKFKHTALYLYARRVNANWKRQNRFYMRGLKLLSRNGFFTFGADLKRMFPDIRQGIEMSRKRLHGEIKGRNFGA